MGIAAQKGQDFCTLELTRTPDAKVMRTSTKILPERRVIELVGSRLLIRIASLDPDSNMCRLGQIQQSIYGAFYFLISLQRVVSMQPSRFRYPSSAITPAEAHVLECTYNNRRPGTDKTNKYVEFLYYRRCCRAESSLIREGCRLRRVPGTFLHSVTRGSRIQGA